MKEIDPALVAWAIKLRLVVSGEEIAAAVERAKDGNEGAARWCQRLAEGYARSLEQAGKPP